MKKATTNTSAKATTKTTAKPATKKTPVKKAAAQKTESVKSDKMETLNKLERALAENQISRKEYDMWREVYAKETPFNTNIIEEEDYRPRKTRRRSY